MTNEEMMLEIERLSAENKKLKAVKGTAAEISFKVSEKGAVSVYRLNTRWPVTLYAEQWERLFRAVPELQAFIEANRDKLSVKAPKDES